LPFQRLQAAAREAGFELTVASGFRSYARQRQIWLEKLKGQRPLLSADGALLDAACLPEKELLHALLRWSALPGASRHHWGTDIDIYDAAALPANSRLQLVPEEYQAGGPMHELSCWLDERISSQQSEGFFRPYQRDLGGVAAEPWHLSHYPVAHHYEQQWSLDVFKGLVAELELSVQQALLAEAEHYYQTYVINICQPEWVQ
jgi:LAS superfamily LD-carboxypeptidase LdcB